MPIRTAELLRTKLQRPGVTRDLVPRPRLIERLNQAVAVPLTLVCAPAGFGKSTLVSSWIEGMTTSAAGVTPPLPSAWLSLDENDSDLVLFLRYFIAALRTIAPGTCAKSAEMLAAPRQPPTELLVATLSNEIALLPDRFVLVLDDFYTVQGEAVFKFLNALVRHWLQPMHLVLISRLSPSLPLASLRAKGQIVEIRTHDLRFSREETAEYMAQVLAAPLSKPGVAFLEQYTEGWIAGLHLASLSLRAGEDPETTLASLSGANMDIASYLVDEVLLRQPRATQTFLLRTSILDRFCASLCESLAGREDPECNSRACIERVERADLFVIPLDDRAEWYRYHHLFRGLLERRLRTEASPDQVNELHYRAAAWFAGRGLIDEALHHAMAADDLDLAARLMQQGLCDVLNREDRPTLDRWLRLLPEDFIQHRPWLMMIKAAAFQFSWQLPTVWKLLDQIEAQLAERPLQRDEGGEAAPQAGDPHDLRVLRGLIASYRAQQAFVTCQAARAIAYSEEALALLPAGWRFLRGAVRSYWGMSMRAIGRADAAQGVLSEEYGSLLSKTDVHAAYLQFAMCFNYLETGQLEQARPMAQVLLEGATSGRQVILQGFAHYFLGVIFYCRNELDAARQHFEEVVDKRYSTHALAARGSVVGLVRVHLARSEITEAWQAMELLRQLDWDRMGQEGDDAHSLRAQLDYLQGNTEGAFGWADAYTISAPDRLLNWLQDPHMAKAHILLARGTDADVQSALDITDALYKIAQRSFSVSFQIEILALRALALEMQGQGVEALAALWGPGPARTRSIALWAAIGGAISVSGPMLSGLLLEVTTWPWVFLIVIPVAVVALLMALKFIPAHINEGKESVDNIGGILSVVLIGTFVLALNFLPVASARTMALGLLLIAVIATVLFVLRQRRAKNPLYDLKVAVRPTFWVAALGGIIVFGSLMGAMFIGQQFMQDVLGYSTLNSGLAVLPAGLFMILAAPRSAKLVEARGSRFTLLAGYTFVLLGFLTMLLFWKENVSYLPVGLAYALVGLGIGLAGTPASRSLTGSVPVTRVGMASGTADLQRDLGGAIFNSLFGALLATGYAAAMTAAIAAAPQGAEIPASVTSSLTMSYAGAQTVAAEYPQYASQITAAAQNAFMAGDQTAYIAGIIAVLIGAVLVFFVFPKRDKEREVLTAYHQQDMAAMAAQQAEAPAAATPATQR
jgi:DHA2 family multidrug resistance protein-like MFS transporter